MNKNILKVAKKLKLNKNEVYCYGNEMAKILQTEKTRNKEKNLVLVTAINPTSSGEGKTTIAIALADSLNKLKKQVCLTLREPSLGPVFGAKGGATGNGMYCVTPVDKINLHFTGDMHALTSANNLLCAMVDNHIYQGNELNLDINKICVHRCIDINDRALRNIKVSVNNKKPEFQRTEQFYLTSASEIMSILCLSKNFQDLKERIGNILIAYNKNNMPVYAKDLKAENAVAVLLKDAIKPNLVQTKNGTPAIIHGGPFANLSIGCNSYIALNTALNLSNYVITEAGFGADLGAQKFFDVMCKNFSLQPKCVVLVVTVKALKEHGENLLCNGILNAKKHYQNITKLYNQKCIIAINKFSSDSDEEIAELENLLKENNMEYCLCDISKPNSSACTDLAKAVIEKCRNNNKELTYSHSKNTTITEQITSICKNVYGATEVEISTVAKQKIINLSEFSDYNIIISKTPYSFSSNSKLKGMPKEVKITINDVVLYNGAKLIVAMCGDILFLPALTKTPRCVNMKISENGDIL